MTRLAIIVFLLLCSSRVLGEIEYGGEGCPAGTAIASIDDNGDATISLDAYRISKSGSGLARTSCNIAWPYSVPIGYAVAAAHAQVSGKLDLKDNTQAQFQAENFIAGSTGKKYSSTVDEPQNNPVEYTVPGQHNHTSCGQSVIIRLNTSINLNAREAAEASNYEITHIIIKKPLLIKCERAPELKSLADIEEL